MLGRTRGASLHGIRAELVDVEVDLTGGLPTIATVGLPDSAVREGVDRIRSALRHAGFKLPQHRVVINLAPAERRKQGGHLDLPIAVALLAADGQLSSAPDSVDLWLGELALDGTVRPVRGALNIAIAAAEVGLRRIAVPAASADEAALVQGIEIVPIRHLSQLAPRAGGLPEPHRVDGTGHLERLQELPTGPDLRDVRGQESARRALEIAAAGGHHLLLSGAPGSGKTMLARRLPGILPPPSLEEALEVTQIWSAAGLARGLVVHRPFRAPHHGVTLAGMTGGGNDLRAGEVSLASGGVLYLDELTEFRREALEALRQPLEDGRIRLVRLRESADLPAGFQLVASMNPCPCGFHGTPDHRCRCSDAMVARYLSKLSGPLLDRFDLIVDVPALDPKTLGQRPCGEDSGTVRERVIQARRLQSVRYRDSVGVHCNAQLPPDGLERWVGLESDARRFLGRAATSLGLSARGYDRVRRVARTLADLEGVQVPRQEHVAEALRYRPANLPGRSVSERSVVDDGVSAPAAPTAGDATDSSSS